MCRSFFDNIVGARVLLAPCACSGEFAGRDSDLRTEISQTLQPPSPSSGEGRAALCGLAVPVFVKQHMELSESSQTWTGMGPPRALRRRNQLCDCCRCSLVGCAVQLNACAPRCLHVSQDGIIIIRRNVSCCFEKASLFLRGAAENGRSCLCEEE